MSQGTRTPNMYVCIYIPVYVWHVHIYVSVCLFVALLSLTHWIYYAREGGGREGRGRKEMSFYDTRRSAVPISDTIPHKRKKYGWNPVNDN